jgi:hypothetical protein
MQCIADPWICKGSPLALRRAYGIWQLSQLDVAPVLGRKRRADDGAESGAYRTAERQSDASLCAVRFVR